MEQFAVIGLGNFGFYLARHLFKKGHDVMAIDKISNRVQSIKDHVNQAIVADSTDKRVLENIGLHHMDVVVVSIGSSLNASILTALNLVDIGVKRIVAKANSDEHARILLKIGVNEIVFPERDIALSIGERLHNPNMLEYLPFIEGYGIMNLATPPSFAGKTLKELNLINLFDVQVVAIKDTLSDKMIMIPKADHLLKESDIMVLLGPNESFEKLSKIGS